MVAQHYRWDFIGLSTDVKPIPETSEKVVDGSTFYCSDTSKLYVYCKDNWYERKSLGGGGGGGTSYTAGTGIDITSDVISVDTATIQEKLTAGTNITIADNVISASGGTSYTAGANVSISDENVISATDTTYSNFTGTDGQTAGTAGLVPAPATTDVDKFLKSDGTWATSGGGGGDTVYSTVTTSNASDGGAVYIGPLNASQEEQPDPTTTDNHYRYFWALPFDASGQDIGTPRSETINIGGTQISGTGNVTLGYRTSATGDNNTVLGRQAQANGYASNVVVGHSAQSSGSSAVVLGRSANTTINGTVALGAYSQPTRGGEVNVGTSSSSYGFNDTNYRVIGGVHDGQELHDCATVAQGNTLSTSAPTSSTEGVLGQLWTDTTNMHTYQCTAISGSTYTWTQRW